MNGLSSVSSWGGEQKQLLEYVYGAIDSKIDFVELNTRKLLAKFSRKEAPVQAEHRTDALQVVPVMAGNSENDEIFTYLEQLSRTITMLENMKYSLREHNATSIMQLLDDDKFMNFDASTLNEVLDLKDNFFLSQDKV